MGPAHPESTQVGPARPADAKPRSPQVGPTSPETTQRGPDRPESTPVGPGRPVPELHQGTIRVLHYGLYQTKQYQQKSNEYLNYKYQGNYSNNTTTNTRNKYLRLRK